MNYYYWQYFVCHIYRFIKWQQSPWTRNVKKQSVSDYVEQIVFMKQFVRGYVEQANL